MISKKKKKVKKEKGRRDQRGYKGGKAGRREGGKSGGKEEGKKRKPIFIDIINWDVYFQERDYCCCRAQEAEQTNIPLDQNLLDFLSRCTLLLDSQKLNTEN